MRHIAANTLTLMILACLGVVLAIGWARGQYESVGPLEQAICLTVEPGSNMRRVSEDLYARGAISSGIVFRSSANYEGVSGKLKAGAFVVPAKATMGEIIEIVTGSGLSTCGTEVIYQIGINSAQLRVRALDPETGNFSEQARFNPAEEAVPEIYASALEDRNTRYRVTFAEGATSWQVVDALAAAEFLAGDVDGIPDEGSLAPDSYEVRPGDDRTALIDRMQEAQANRLEEAWLRRDPETPLKTREEALILASIIEKETGLGEERPQVASVFVNRLNKGMRLQTDPTVIYGITKGQGVLGRGLRRSELDRATPYNTYVIDRLPPTPIANPGDAAIKAALNPAETDYIYFVADGTGGHAFARTLTEHNTNVRKWREIEAQRARDQN